MEDRRAGGALIREARLRAGLSQTELGRRASVSQSVISAYEAGARQPSVPVLTRLVEATGFSLEMKVKGRRRPALHRRAELTADRRSRAREIAASYGLTNLRVFGSVARGDQTAGSDIDLLVDVPPGVGLIQLARCQRDLEALFGLPVDLVPAADLKPSVAHEALAQAVAL